MWPIYLIAAKFLKMEEGMVGCGSGVGGHGGDGSHVREAYGDGEEGQRRPMPGMGCDGPVSSSRSHFIDVPHIRQLCNWDCGLACVLMVLRTLGINNINIHDLEDLCCTTRCILRTCYMAMTYIYLERQHLILGSSSFAEKPSGLGTYGWNAFECQQSDCS